MRLSDVPPRTAPLTRGFFTPHALFFIRLRGPGNSAQRRGWVWRLRLGPVSRIWDPIAAPMTAGARASAAPKISVTLEPITSEQATNGQRLLFIPGGLHIVKVKLPARVACKSMNHAQKYLSQANRQIAELTVQHARQRVIVKNALDTGQRAEMAESLLDALEGSLRIFEKHRIFLLGYSVNRPNRRLQRQI